MSVAVAFEGGLPYPDSTTLQRPKSDHGFGLDRLVLRLVLEGTFSSGGLGSGRGTRSLLEPQKFLPRLGPGFLRLGHDQRKRLVGPTAGRRRDLGRVGG